LAIDRTHPRSKAMPAYRKHEPITTQQFYLALGGMIAFAIGLGMFSLLQDNQANAADISSALEDVPKSCQTFASTQIRFEIMDRGEALGKDDIREIVEKYENHSDEDCDIMAEQLSGTNITP